MTYQETEILIQKYLNGETIAEEERLLALEVSRKDAPSDWKIVAGMLGELTIDQASLRPNHGRVQVQVTSSPTHF